MEYKKLKLNANFIDVWCDFAIYDYDMDESDYANLIYASVFKRGNLLRSFTASLQNNCGTLICDKEQEIQIIADNYDFYHTSINMGHDRVNHAYILNKKIKKEYVFCNETNFHEIFYEYFMENFDLPLMREWIPKIVTAAQLENKIQFCSNIVCTTNGTKEILIYHKKLPLVSLLIYKINISQKWLDNLICKLLIEKEIQICQTQQVPLNFCETETPSLDKYFQEYGHTIIKNLDKYLKPLSPPNGIVNEIVLKNIKPFPEQSNIINGVVKLLETTSKYAIINEGMGCGKSIQALAVIEAYYVKKYLKSHPKCIKATPKETLEEIYIKPNTISYRAIIVAPGHLLQKWANEASRIPYSEVKIVTEFSDLVQIKENGKKRTKREIYIIGKDFLKLSSSLSPVPYKTGYKSIPVLKCHECGVQAQNYNVIKRNKKCICSSRNWIKQEDTAEQHNGLLCPECNEILVNSMGIPLTISNFSNKNDANSFCSFCGTTLWKPNVNNINGKEKKSKWNKFSYFPNRTHKTRDTLWLLEGHEHETLTEKHIEEKYVLPANQHLTRKVAPSTYIKNQLKHFFDFCVLDELHLYKGGKTAQGIAVHSIIKSSKKVIGLTGTIAGGVASDLFYILYRLDPGRMIKRGFKYSNVTEFTQKYGTLETLYEITENTKNHNKNSKGKKLQEPKTKPGISPLIFTDFLIDRTVFLDLDDMGEHLPELKEKIIEIDMDSSVASEYYRIIRILNNCNKGKFLNPLSAALLQFSMSYLDKPYGYGPIIHPKTGAIIAIPKTYENDTEPEKLLPKEQKLVELVNNEQNENRNLFVFCEFTGKEETRITERLKKIIEDNCNLKNKVAILPSTVQPQKREAWIHKKAAQGIKVFICNPKCVETGLDFIFTYKNVTYNYPTIIFYQMGYNLFTLWQASRRSYRLIQDKECRVFYLAYRSSVQEVIIGIMAEKQVATAAIQGKFSAEGLASMANGVDARIRMLQALTNNDYNTNSIKKFQTIKHQNKKSSFSNFHIEDVLTFEDLELVSNAGISIATKKEEIDVFDYIAFSTLFIPTQTEYTNSCNVVIPSTQTTQKNIRKKKQKTIAGQISIF